MKCMRIHARTRMTATSLLPATESSPQRPLHPYPGGSILVSTSFDMKNYLSAPYSWNIISHHKWLCVYVLWQHLSRWWNSHELWFLFTHSFYTSSVASPLQSSLSSCWSCIGSFSPLGRRCWAIFTLHRWLQKDALYKYRCPLSASASPFQTTATTGPTVHPRCPSTQAKPPNNCPLNPPTWGVMK